MAYVSATSSDHSDLYADLISFLTANAALVSAGQAWTVAWQHASGQESGVVLKGPGLAGADDIYVGMRLVTRPTPDEYEIQIVGMTGVLPASTSFDDHVNVSPTKVRLFVDSGPMTRWFVANGRRFVVVVKISTVFQAAYAGLILPYGLPEHYGYPLFVGGSAGETTATDLSSWRSTSVGHHHFPHGYYGTSSPSYSPAAYLLSPSGDWLPVGATGTETTVCVGPLQFSTGLGVERTTGSSNYGYQTIRQRICAGFADELLLTPHTLVQKTPSDQTYGILDGTFHVPGFGNSSENIVTIGAVNHLTVQDAFRTGIGDYWALALE